VAIAANPEYSSLNLAMAVQVIAYEVRMAWLATQEQEQAVEHEETPYPLVDDLERFYGHLEQTLLATGFIREGHPGQVMNKLRRLFTRARPESQELNILRGMLASIEQKNKVVESFAGWRFAYPAYESTLLAGEAADPGAAKKRHRKLNT
jgi:tRNA (cytidine32/uridine32-2'-O)-methyltransferase